MGALFAAHLRRTASCSLVNATLGGFIGLVSDTEGLSAGSVVKPTHRPSVLATREPMAQLRVLGRVSLPFAERILFGWPNQAPPRETLWLHSPPVHAELSVGAAV
jgi:hypothetical protein